MAKATIPVRLDKELMKSAIHAGVMESRSAAAQIEYWARIGRVLSRVLTPADITGLITGSVELSVSKADQEYSLAHPKNMDITLESLIAADSKSVMNLSKEETEWLSETPQGNAPSTTKSEIDTSTILELLSVWEAAAKTFRSVDKASVWLDSHLPTLGAKPVALLTTKDGREKVMAALQRIERGDFGS